MKINKLILKILFLYLFIFLMLLLSIYLILPFNFWKFVFINFINTSFTSLLFLISMFLIYKNIKDARRYSLCLHFNDVLGNTKKHNTNNYMNKVIYCSNIIYFICKNIPFILYFLGLIIPTLITTIFKEKNIFITCLLSAFSSVVFYIFLRRIF